MTERRVIPLKEMSLAGCVAFLRELHWRHDADHYTIKLDDLSYFTPFGMLICSTALRHFREAKPQCSFDLSGWEDHTYAAHMGFFRAFGAEHGKEPGEATGSETYLPVTFLDLDELRDEAKTNMTVVQTVIEERAHTLARVLVQQEKGELMKTLGFAMTEMFRNVLEHSGAPQIGYCAQYWPSKDKVEVGILDGGKGVRAALEQNPYLEIESDQHALHLAILPGVSGKVFEGVKTDPYDHWAHSGFGLYMTSGICRAGGNFFICSGNSGVRLQEEEKTHHEIDFQGTALRLTIRPSRIGELQRTLSDLSDKGEEIAKGIEGAVINASAASKMVREQRAEWPDG